MSTNPQVVVRGEAVLTVPPEVADVVATVRVTARDRQTALERCQSRLADVTAVVGAAGDAVEEAVTAGVQVYEEHHERRPPEPVATVHTRLVLGRIDAAGELLVALGGLDDVAVDGPWWRLRPDSRAHEEARLAAIRDAVRRARVYAEAFGAEITELVEVADAGLTRNGGARFAERASGVAAFESNGPRLELTPEQQRVHGSVEARFVMSVPDPEVFRR
jgi:uncharacterized protein YggE